MLRADYTDEERKKFQQLRYNYPDARIMRRFEILWLHACGKFVPEIAEIVQQNPDTVGHHVAISSELFSEPEFD